MVLCLLSLLLCTVGSMCVLRVFCCLHDCECVLERASVVLPALQGVL